MTYNWVIARKNIMFFNRFVEFSLIFRYGKFFPNILEKLFKKVVSIERPPTPLCASILPYSLSLPKPSVNEKPCG